MKRNCIQIVARFERSHRKSFRLFAQETGSYKASALIAIKLLKLEVEGGAMNTCGTTESIYSIVYDLSKFLFIIFCDVYRLYT